MRALVALATVRAWVGRDVTTRALPRPPPASGTSVYHAPVNTFFHSLSFESKDTRELADTQRLQQISTIMIQEGNTDALHQQILDAAIALMRSDMGGIHMFDPDRNELRLLAWKGFHPESAAFWEWVRLDSDSCCGAPLRTGQLRRVLQRSGYEVTTAATGQEGLAALEERSYAVILCDMRMPDLDGPGFYRELERRYPHLLSRVIFLTGDVLSPETQGFLAQFDNPRLKKPCKAQEVRRVIEQVLESR